MDLPFFVVGGEGGGGYTFFEVEGLFALLDHLALLLLVLAEQLLAAELLRLLVFFGLLFCFATHHQPSLPRPKKKS